MKRWYDEHPAGKYLDQLKEMSKKERDPIVIDIFNIIKKNKSSRIEDAVLDFPLETFKRRWYDKDPYLWLIFNGLQNANINLLNDVEIYFKNLLDEIH